MASSTILTILEAMQTKIRALTLTDVVTDGVQIYKVPKESLTSKNNPGVLICPFGAEAFTYPVAGKIDITIPTLWAYYDYDQQDQKKNEDRNYLSRETILNAFEDDHRLTGVSSMVDRKIKPMPILNAGMWMKHSIFFSGSVIDFTYRRTRGS